MAKMIAVYKEGLSVRELITVLKKCKNQDAWVVLPESPALDEYRHDPFKKLVGVRATTAICLQSVSAPRQRVGKALQETGLTPCISPSIPSGLRPVFVVGFRQVRA
jgi:hypothetical protein